MDQKTKWLAARAWVDLHSGADTWRVVRIVEWADNDAPLRRSGFLYDGPGFFSPRFVSWDDNYAEYWRRIARHEFQPEELAAYRS